MDIKRLSRQTCRLPDPPGVVSWASVAGRLERQGPLGGSIDITDDDSFFGKKTWEQGEAEMQALERTNIANALQRCHGKIYGEDGAAALLGISPTTLCSRIKKFGLRKQDS